MLAGEEESASSLSRSGGGAENALDHYLVNVFGRRLVFLAWNDYICERMKKNERQERDKEKNKKMPRELRERSWVFLLR